MASVLDDPVDRQEVWFILLLANEAQFVFDVLLDFLRYAAGEAFCRAGSGKALQCFIWRLPLVILGG